MINFSLLGLGVMCSQSMNELLQVTYYIQETNDPNEPVGDLKSHQVQNWLELWKEEAQSLEWDKVVISLDRLHQVLDSNASYQDLENGLIDIKEQIETSLNYQYLFRYSKDCLDLIQKWKNDWSDVLTKFPNTSNDIYSGVDLLCLDHTTASVFHMMRVFEKGLMALANSFGVLDKTNIWQDVSNAIEAEISNTQAKRKSVKKSNRIQFLCDIAKQMRFMEARWEKYSSNETCLYDASEAQIVMDQTKQFMSLLAVKLAHQDFIKATAA